MDAKATHVDLANPEYCRWRRFLAEADQWDREEIERYQLAELRRVVRHAYENTFGYRKKFAAAKVSPESIHCLEDIRLFPFVTKEEIRDKLHWFSAARPDCSYVTTGGSTGIPFGFYRTQEAFWRELASKAHQYSRVGWREGDRQLVFRGLPIETENHMSYVPEFEELRCSSYHLSGKWLDEFYEAACEYRPEWIRCYPSSGYLFATYLKDSGRRLPPVKGVLCASENLYGFQKALFREVFGGRIFSHYGHYELAALAGYCEHADTYHVLPQYGFVELVDPQGQPVTQPGRTGEIVATSFLMEATPFIRYRTADIAVLKGWGCELCGRPYQIWERVEGRLQEFVISATGRLISMTAINMHDDVFDCIKQFQFHQAERGKVTMRYIPKPGCSMRELEDIRRRLMVKFGEDIELRFAEVREIPLTPRGKHRFLIQEMRLPCHDAGEASVWDSAVKT